MSRKLKKKKKKQQFSEFRNKINEQNEYFTKHIETQNQTEIWELKNSKHALGSSGNRANDIKQRINQVEYRNIEIIFVEKETE